MQVNNKVDRFFVFNRKWLIIFFLISFSRIIYILMSNNITNDSLFYLNIADNINNGFGFSYTDQSGNIEKVFGGYFPGYPYFIYLTKFLGFGNKINILIVALLTSSSIIYLTRTLYSTSLKEKYIYLTIIILGLSPLGIGFSRWLLIEPILYIFSILLLTEFIKLKYKPKKLGGNMLRIFIFSIFSIYFKPTMLIVIIPHFLILLTDYGIKKLFKFFILYSLCLSLFIIPWGLRDLQYGANIPFNANSNISPKNIKAFINWLTTFSISEYDQNNALYPIFSRSTGDRRKVIITTIFNPFISKNDNDFKEVKKLLNKDNPDIKRGFTNKEKKLLNKLAKLRSKKNGILGNFFLYFIKILGLLINPLNSWGWAVSINPEDYNYMLRFYFKFIFKAFLFIYRLALFYFYFESFISVTRSIKFKKLFSEYNQKIISSNIILIASFSLLFSNMFLHVGLFGLLEHRYLYPVIPWIEFSVLTRFFISKKI